jgi:Ca2+-binding EF-hand superfamily protein
MVRSFQRLDTDGDAMVTLDEFQEPFAGLVARLDADGDGLINADELRETMRARHGERRDGRRGWGPDRMPQPDN